MVAPFNLAEWTAIALGAVAVALGFVAVIIAIWDHVRDDYYFSRAEGPVEIELTEFDIPQPELRVHNVLLGGSFRQFDAVAIRLKWKIRNRVSWPVYVTLVFRSDVPDLAKAWRQGPWTKGVVVQDELFNDVGGTQFFAPPRQPIERTEWIYWERGVAGSITPTCSVFGKTWRTIAKPAKTVEWSDDQPKLIE